MSTPTQELDPLAIRLAQGRAAALAAWHLDPAQDDWAALLSRAELAGLLPSATARQAGDDHA